MTARATFTNQRTTVPTHLNLVGHYENRVPGGVAVGSLGLRFVLGDGTTVEVPTLFKPINDHLAIAPAVTVDGAVLRFNLGRWAPMRYGPRDGALFAVAFTGPDIAARVAFALEADPRASWHWPAEDASAWCRTHAARLGFRFT